MLASLPDGGEDETGTVIVLERVKLRTRDLAKLKADLVRAAGETYSKFLGGSTDATYRRLAINIDGTEVEPVDPLHRENKETLLLIKREKIAFEDGSSAFFTAVALPHPQSQPPDIQRRYRYTVKTQGIYVYRNGRLVRSGETFDLSARTSTSTASGQNWNIPPRPMCISPWMWRSRQSVWMTTLRCS